MNNQGKIVLKGKCHGNYYDEKRISLDHNVPDAWPVKYDEVYLCNFDPLIKPVVYRSLEIPVDFDVINDDLISGRKTVWSVDLFWNIMQKEWVAVGSIGAFYDNPSVAGLGIVFGGGTIVRRISKT